MQNRHLKKRNIILTILIALAVLAAMGTGLHLWELHSQQEEQFGDSGDWGKGNTGPKYLTIGEADYYYTDDVDAYLLIGTDASSKADNDVKKKGFDGDLADFLVLVMINNTQEKYAFFQIDRDTITDVPVLDEKGESTGTYPEQICTAHWYGQNEDQRNKNTIDTVSYVFGGLKIKGAYVLNMKDIAAVNHAIGGVVVDIETDMTNVDPEFKKGASVLLDDKQAEKFVRARMDVGKGTNKERMARQRQYMQKVYNLVLSQIRENPDYFDELYAELDGHVDSTMQASEVSRIANRFDQFESLGIIQPVGESKSADTLLDGVRHSEFYPDYVKLAEQMAKVMDLDDIANLEENQ